MPNGKGSLECCYCVQYRGEWQGYDAAYEPGFCKFHRANLPATNGYHRICSNFSPNEYYLHDNPVFEVEGIAKRISAEERFSWFDTWLEPNVLYVFSYNDPRKVQGLLKFGGESS
jgi:hypothetical protein